MNKFFNRERCMPLILTAAIIALDQITKALVVKFIEIGGPYRGPSIEVFGNDFLRLCHVRNKAIAFSLGHGLPEAIKPVVFIILPLLVLAFLVCYYFKSDEFNKPQRFAIAGILGGGIGNIIDRIFRPDGVVDFIDVKFYDLFGWERWPTFNVADSSVVVCCILLFTFIIFSRKNGIKKNE